MGIFFRLMNVQASSPPSSYGITFTYLSCTAQQIRILSWNVIWKVTRTSGLVR